MRFKRIAVLRGGPSEEYAVSMETGAAVLKALEEMKYPYKDIVITKKGEWLDEGKVKTPKNTLDAIDTVFIALHGAYGEDGGVQKLLQDLEIPFTGSKAMPSAIAFNKTTTKDLLKDMDIKMPKHKHIKKDSVTDIESLVDSLNKELGEELFIKPNTGGSSQGARYSPNKDSLRIALKELFEVYESLLIEEFIQGKEATVGVLNDFRDELIYSLPAIEIVPPSGEPLFSFENKYNGKTKEICPGRFSYKEKTELEEMARKIHSELRCDHYSRSDFILRNGDVYFLEINTLPGLTSESLMHKAAAAVGLGFNDLIEHLIEIANRK